MALVLFGKLTAGTEAQAAGISITAATLNVGPAATLAGMIIGHKVMVGLTVGALTVGTVAPPLVSLSTQSAKETTEIIAPVVQGAVPLNAAKMDIWYYYPVGPGPNDQGSSRLHIMRACEDSLCKLKTDYIDLFQLHRPCFDIPIDETLSALTDLIRQGKVRYIGSSS